MTEQLDLRYIPLSQAVKWERNAKKHDIPKLINAIRRYGFQDPIKFDTALNGGQGGTVFGNGRIEALLDMQQNGYALPKGIQLAADGEWLVPCLFGNDLPTQQAAEAFAIDHNNLVAAGGDFSDVYLVKMWAGVPYTQLLIEQQMHGLKPLTAAMREVDNLTNTANPQRQAKTTTRIAIGKYAFDVPTADYNEWLAETMAELADPDDLSGLKLLIQERLGLTELMEKLNNEEEEELTEEEFTDDPTAD